MKAGTSASSPYSAFDCAVCGAQLDQLHTETDREGLHCSFCGSLQGRTAEAPNLKLVPSEGSALDVGEALRSARKARGETLEQAAHFTRIHIHYLKDLEAGDVSSLESYPGHIYARFFLREYADHLGLDPQPLVTRFDRDVEPAFQLVSPARYSSRGRHPGRWAGGALILLVAALIASAIVSREDGRSLVAQVTPSTGTPATLADAEAHEISTPAVRRPGIDVVIRTSLPCWIRAVTDGRTVMGKTVPAGRTIRLQATETMELRLGNAGGVEVTMNGRSISTGETGNVLDLSFIRDGGRVVIA